jgi:hypothetical protein
MEALWNIYRDTNQKEIDMVIEEAGIVHPVEIKKATNPEKRVVKAFKVLETTNNSVDYFMRLLYHNKVSEVSDRLPGSQIVMRR